jgi:hypothetical protein
VLSFVKVLGGTTAGFPMPRNNSRDINSKDSLINYLRHSSRPLDVAARSLRSRTRRQEKVPGSPQSGVPEHRQGRVVP